MTRMCQKCLRRPEDDSLGSGLRAVLPLVPRDETTRGHFINNEESPFSKFFTSLAPGRATGGDVKLTGYKRIVIFLILMLLPMTAFANDASKVFYEGVSLYEEGRYNDALERFVSIADKGIENGKLAYNIGNTHMQKGDLGRALLWYERAARLMPKDPDLVFNRNVALAQVKDRQEETGNPVFSVLFFWKKGVPLKTLQWLAIGSGLLFWAFLTLYLLLRQTPLKTAAALSGALFALLASTALWDTAVTSRIQNGVVLPKAVSVRSGLSDTATELFTLHAGSRVVVEQERSGWVRIGFAEGKIGWVKKETVGVI
jgi:hypothetical protein